MKYAYLGKKETYLVIVSANLSCAELDKLLRVLRKRKSAIGWTIDDVKGISPSICMHRIFLENDYKPKVQGQRQLNLIMQEVVRKEVLKLLDAGMIYAIFYSDWEFPTQVVSKKGGMMVVQDNRNELIATRLVTSWRVCIDYRANIVFPPHHIKTTSFLSPKIKIKIQEWVLHGNVFSFFLIFYPTK